MPYRIGKIFLGEKKVWSIVISQYEVTCYRRQSSILASDCSPGALVPAVGNNMSHETWICIVYSYMLIIHLYIFNKKEMNSKYFNFVNNGGGFKKPIWLFNKQTLRIFTNEKISIPSMVVQFFQLWKLSLWTLLTFGQNIVRARKYFWERVTFSESCLCSTVFTRFMSSLPL